MKRDMDLVRKILLKIEEADEFFLQFEPEEIEEGLSREQLGHHLSILAGAGLINGINSGVMGDPHRYIVNFLTWEGHEFLDNARDEGLWNSTKEKTGVISFESLKQVLSKLATAAALKAAGL